MVRTHEKLKEWRDNEETRTNSYKKILFTLKGIDTLNFEPPAEPSESLKNIVAKSGHVTDITASHLIIAYFKSLPKRKQERTKGKTISLKNQETRRRGLRRRMTEGIEEIHETTSGMIETERTIEIEGMIGEIGNERGSEKGREIEKETANANANATVEQKERRGTYSQIVRY